MGRQRWKRWVFAAVLAASLGLSAGSAGAGGSGTSGGAPRQHALAVSLVPNELSLARGEPATVVLVLQNNSGEEVTGIDVVSAAVAEPLRVAPAMSTIASIPAGSSATTPVTVSRTDEASGDSLSAPLIVSYTQR